MKFWLYVGNRIRVLDQQIEIKKYEENLRENESNYTSCVILELKIKYNPVRYHKNKPASFWKTNYDLEYIYRTLSKLVL